jgi:hypothetical protein
LRVRARVQRHALFRITEFNVLNARIRCGRDCTSIFLDEIKFSFLNGNLVVQRRRRPISTVQPGAAHLEKVQIETN